MMDNEKELMVSQALNTKEGRKLLWDKGLRPAIDDFITNVFLTWNRPRQIRFIEAIGGPSELS